METIIKYDAADCAKKYDERRFDKYNEVGGRRNTVSISLTKYNVDGPVNDGLACIRKGFVSGWVGASECAI